jgi:hypothetical protein
MLIKESCDGGDKYKFLDALCIKNDISIYVSQFFRLLVYKGICFNSLLIVL